MIQTFICLTAAGAVAVLISVGASARPAATPVLRGTVGPGFTISLKRNGTRGRTLKAGRYKFVITDKRRATTSPSSAERAASSRGT